MRSVQAAGLALDMGQGMWPGGEALAAWAEGWSRGKALPSRGLRLQVQNARGQGHWPHLQAPWPLIHIWLRSDQEQNPGPASQYPWQSLPHSPLAASWTDFLPLLSAWPTILSLATAPLQPPVQAPDPAQPPPAWLPSPPHAQTTSPLGLHLNTGAGVMPTRSLQRPPLSGVSTALLAGLSQASGMSMQPCPQGLPEEGQCL